MKLAYAWLWGAVLLPVLGLPSAATADVTIATMKRATTIDAWAGYVAWSSYEASTDRYVLRLSYGRQLVPLPRIAQGRPFDVDLGPGPDGGLRVVWSRCSSAGCAIEAIRPSWARSKTILRVSQARVLARPSQWGGRVLVLSRTRGATPRYTVTGVRGRKRETVLSLPRGARATDVELRGTRYGIVAEKPTQTCGGADSAELRVPITRFELILSALGGAPRTVATGCSTASPEVRTLAFGPLSIESTRIASLESELAAGEPAPSGQAVVRTFEGREVRRYSSRPGTPTVAFAIAERTVYQLEQRDGHYVLISRSA